MPFCLKLTNIDTISAHVPKCVLQFASEKTSVYRHDLYISVCNLRNTVSGVAPNSLKVTNSSLWKIMLFCLSMYMKKVMMLLAFTFEQSSSEVKPEGCIGSGESVH